MILRVKRTTYMLMEFLLALFIIVYLMRHHVQASEAGEVYIGITNEKGESLFCENGGTICYNRMIFFHQIRESPVPIEYYVMEEECAPKEHEPIEWELLTSQGVILPLQTDEETIAVRSYHIMFRFQTLEKLLESEDIERGFLENNLVENKEKSFQPIVYECRVIIDQKEPEIKLDSTAELLVWQKDMITCKAVVSECESALKSFDCYINGNVIKQIKWEQTDDQKSQVFEFELTEETTKAGGSILIEACDLAGNKSVYQGTYYLDQTAPVLLVDMPEDKVYAEAVTLVCTNEEMNYEGSSLLVKRVRNELIETPLSMQAETEVIDFSSEHNTTELHFDQEGSYLIELQATDPAGNESESKVCEFSIDLTKPQITINGITEDCFVNREVDFEVVISDLHTQVEIACYIEEGLKQGVCMNDSWYLEQGEGKRAYHLSDDGIYMIRVKAVDQAGNQTVAEIHMGIDQSAPVTAIAGVENELVTNRAQSVICYVEEQFYQSGIVRMRSEHKGFHESELTLSEYPFITSGTLSSSEVHFAEEGRYELNLNAKDRAGNESTSSVSFTIDRTPPLIKTMKQFDGTYLEQFQLPKNMESNINDDSGYIYQVFLNGKKMDATQIVSKPGRYILRIEATDDAGNQSTKQMHFIIRRKSISENKGPVSINQLTEQINLNETAKNETANNEAVDHIDQMSGRNGILHRLLSVKTVAAFLMILAISICIIVWSRRTV